MAGRFIHIGERLIGPQRPVFVVAEIGVNHDGLLQRALELVEHARAAGADAVKLQIFSASRLMNATAAFAGYQKDRVSDGDPTVMLRRYELSETQLKTIVAAIVAAGMIALATPFSIPDIETIGALDLLAVKIASPDVVNLPLLDKAAELSRPMMISTGAATMDEIAMTMRHLKSRNADVALLHCVSSYPTPAGQANLSWIRQLADAFGVVAGYSDHGDEIIGGALAVAAGAAIIERHLTYDRAAHGPDHSASSDPQEFAQYIRQLRLAEQMMGTGTRHVLDIEQDVRLVSRQSVVVTRDVAAGTLLSSDDLTTQRPGTGIPAAMLGMIAGQRVVQAISAGTMLRWEMLTAA